MSNASTPEGRGPERPHDAEPFFPSEGTFNPVVPLFEIWRGPDPADVGQPDEAARAGEADGELLQDEEATLVPARAGGVQAARRSWTVTSFVIVLGVASGVALGVALGKYPFRASRPAPGPHARVAAEAPPLQPTPAGDATPAPAAERAEAVTKVEKAKEAVKDKKSKEDSQPEEPGEVARAPKQSPPPQTAPRAERVARAAAEPKEMTPAPKPARAPRTAPAHARPTTAVERPSAPPISTPAAKSKKVIQWP